MGNPLTNKIAFVGGGQMAEAIIAGVLAGEVCRPELLWATDPVPARCDRLKTQFAVRVGSDNRQAVAWADVVVLAVKPQAMAHVLVEIGGDLHRVLVISIAAGTTIQSIMLLLGTAVAQFTESNIDIAPTFFGKGATFLQLAYVLLVIFLSSRQMDLSLLNPLLVAMVAFTVSSGCHYLYRGYRSAGSSPS